MVDTAIIETTRREASHRVRWLILARLAVILLCLALLVIRTLAQPAAGIGPTAVYAMLLSLAVLDVGYLFFLPLIRHGLTTFILVQFLVDIAAETGLSFFTGGVDSIFVNLYFFSIMAASMLLSRRHCSLFAFLAAGGLAVVTTIYLTGVGMELVSPAYVPIQPLPTEKILQRTFLVMGAFFVVAYLSGLLAERLAMARSLNEEILQNMSEGVAVFDFQGAVVFINNEFERIFSPQRPIQLGDTPEKIFSGSDARQLCGLVAGMDPVRFELHEQAEPDYRPPVEVRTSILGKPSDPKGLVMLAIDLSLRHRAELAELRAERFAAVSEMAAGLAHEIRNPLASVRGSIQEMSRDFPEESPNARLARIMLKESDRLNNIITNFLQFARQRPLHPTECSLVKLLREVEPLLLRRGDLGDVKIDLRCSEIPNIRCDAEQIREVFLNLGVNALAAMNGRGILTIQCPHLNALPPGTTKIMRRQVRSQGVAVSFSDTGPGLPPGAHERIFEPFYTTKPHGSGLGLAVARKVVESHEGRIWVRSEPGNGAVFFVWLPLSGPFTPGAPVMNSREGDA